MAQKLPKMIARDLKRPDLMALSLRSITTRDAFKSPPYDNDSPFMTIRLHHGGKMTKVLKNQKYVGGTYSVFDYVNANDFGFEYLNGMSKMLNYKGENKYFGKQQGGYRQLCLSTDLMNFISYGLWKRDVDVYLIGEKSPDTETFDDVANSRNTQNTLTQNPITQTDDISNLPESHIDTVLLLPDVQAIDTTNTQIGSSNPCEEPQFQPTLQPILETENFHDWDDVFNIVDSYSQVYENQQVEGMVGESLGVDKGKNVLVEDDDTVSNEEDINSEHGNESDELYDSEFDNPLDVCDDDMNEELNYDNEEPNQHADDSDDISDDDFLDDGLDCSDFDSNLDSDVEKDVEKFPVYNPDNNFNPYICLKMLFTNKHEFIEAIHNLAIKTRRNLKIRKNDKRRVYAKCMGVKCKWRCHALKVDDEEETVQIREFYTKHQCNLQDKVKNLNSTRLSRRYEASFRADSERKVKGWKRDVQRELKINISKQQAYRARKKAICSIQGKASQQFDLLVDYANELRKSNPGSTVIMQVEPHVENERGTFDRLYICFQALKVGFLAGCRPLIGVDGCHLSSAHKGVLLTAVGVDPCNNLYPIAYAVVSAETKDSWEWFLTLLKEDLQVIRDDRITFISDKQKGLVPAFEKIFPGSDNRFCARHLLANFKSNGWRGMAFRNAFWAAAMATTEAEFNYRMDELGKLDQKALDWFSDKPATQWSRAFFNPFPKCDMLLNNICESFNACILEARDKPILTCLEWIREFLMGRLSEMRDTTKKWIGKRKICPKIRKMLDVNIDKAADFYSLKSDDWNYEVHGYDGSMHVVNLNNETCSCRKWELSGIPCSHSVSALQSQNLDPQNYVSEYYSVNTFMKTYAHAILPMNGPRLWQKTGEIPPLPPNFGRQVGRPKKTRRREMDEPRKKGQGGKNMVRMKQKYSVRCHYCGEKGHNQKGCKQKKEAIASGQLVADAPRPKPTKKQLNPIIRDSSKLTARKRTIGAQALPTSSQTVVNPSPVQVPRKTFYGNQQASTQQRSLINTSSGHTVPVLKKGGRNFVTMKNLEAAVAAGRKKQKTATTKE